jgi:hypothetical protein
MAARITILRAGWDALDCDILRGFDLCIAYPVKVDIRAPTFMPLHVMSPTALGVL